MADSHAEKESERKLRNSARPRRMLVEDGDTAIRSNTVNTYFPPHAADITPRNTWNQRSDAVYPGNGPSVCEESQSFNSTRPNNSRLSPSPHLPPLQHAPPSPPLTLPSRSSTFAAESGVGDDNMVDLELSTKFGKMLSGNHDHDRPMLAENCYQNRDGDT